MSEQNRYERFEERYAMGRLPWDDELPPPEVMALVEKLAPGRALDLGCGYGRSAIYLARHGWQVDGVDFIQKAVTEATKRAQEAKLVKKATFYQGSVADLHFLNASYTLAIDVGCFHSLLAVDQLAYRDELLRLLVPKAQFLLFARTTSGDEEPEDGPPTVDESHLKSLFEPHFQLEHIEIGTTQVEDKPLWNSAWFWYRKYG
ncbi:MAG: methyltransferase domain-containing protein [Chloroflexi bacterium]|nr:MAG: methyltransferase domain-containing protein [Chloroflexota bacterium]